MFGPFPQSKPQLTASKPRFFACCLFAVLSAGQPSANAADYDANIDIRGAMAQGYVHSWGNNFYGSSLDGSNKLSEVAITGRKGLAPRLLASGQLMARRAGVGTDGAVQIDYAQLDYQVLSALDSHAGVRVGRLKNAYGFFNSSRDVVFSRGSVTLPSSVYYDGTGYRDFFFSTDGIQLYGDHQFAGSLGEFTLGWARRYDATEEFRRALVFADWNGSITVDDFWTAQWLHEWFDGRLRTGLSYLSVAVDYINHDTESEIPDIFSETDIYVLSLQWQTERLILTTEARYNDAVTRSNGNTSRTRSDGAYAQARFGLSPTLSSFLRYDVTYPNRNDRSGQTLAANGLPSHLAYGRDLTWGFEWRPNYHWGVFAEYHWINGTASLSQRDNEGRELDSSWQAAMLMLGYRF